MAEAGGEALRHPLVPVGACGCQGQPAPLGAGGEALGAAALLWALEFRDTVDVAPGERDITANSPGGRHEILR